MGTTDDLYATLIQTLDDSDYQNAEFVEQLGNFGSFDQSEAQHAHTLNINQQNSQRQEIVRPLGSFADTAAVAEKIDETHEQQIYTVEKIRAIKFKDVSNCHPLFLIGWEGFADTESTWEPIENLDCLEKIGDFFQMEEPITEASVQEKINLAFEAYKRGMSKNKSKDHSQKNVNSSDADDVCIMLF